MRRLLVLGFALLLIAPAAQAGGFYVGASYLEAGVELDTSGIIGDFDEDDSGYKIYGGWNFFRFFDVEGGYYDFGEQVDILNSTEFTAWNVAAKGKFPLGPVELFAKVGYFFWDVDFASGFTTGDDSGTDLGYGVGLSVVFFKKLELRAEYELVDFDDAELDVVSAGVAWRF